MIIEHLKTLKEVLKYGLSIGQQYYKADLDELCNLAFSKVLQSLVDNVKAYEEYKSDLYDRKYKNGRRTR